jgi:hypothetical protein
MLEERKEGWYPKDMKDVEWVMERVFEHTVEIDALEARKQAIVDNINSMIAEHRSAIETLKYLYLSHLERIVRDAIAGKDTRHVKTPFGRLGFRRTSGSTVIEVTDQEAIEWAEKNAPDIVRKHVNKTDLVERGAPFVRHIPGEDVFYLEPKPRK